MRIVRTGFQSRFLPGRPSSSIVGALTSWRYAPGLTSIKKRNRRQASDPVCSFFLESRFVLERGFSCAGSAVLGEFIGTFRFEIFALELAGLALRRF